MDNFLEMFKQRIDSEPQNLSFIPVPFVFCPLPVRDPNSKSWERTTGNNTLSLSSNTGIPFGKWGRISLSLLITEALKTGNKELELGRVGEVLKSVGQTATGGKSGSITRITNQMDRIGSTYMSFSTLNETNHILGKQTFNVGIADEIELYWSKHDTKDLQPVLFQNRILLSDRFYSLIENHSIPIDLDKYVQMSPKQQDIYSWLIRRFYTLKKPVTISWDLLYTQFGDDVKNNMKPIFRQRFLEALEFVTHKMYKEAKVELVDNGILLKPSPLAIRKEGRIIT